MLRFLLITFLFSSPLIAQTNWFVRPDGGTRAQCDGTHDAAYSGTGINQPCAFKSPVYLEFDGSYTTAPKWIIAGGDIVHIHSGQYRVGYQGPNANDHDGLAIAGNPFASAFFNIPSGTADHPTTFIGDGSTTTQIYGGYGAGAIFALGGVSFITIQGIELTDHGDCTRVGAGYTSPVVGCVTSYPLSDYAQNGITTNAQTHDVVLSDLNIHGFTNRGIIGPIGGAMTADHVRIGFNGAAGWDFDDGKGTKSSADAVVNASYLTVEGNGCNEQYPITNAAFPAASCFDQNSGGYGDGLGTPGTPLNFTCDHCIFRYNTQDGADLLHVSGSTISIINSVSYANMGQQWKLGAMRSVDFENNVWVHNCSRMSAPIDGNSSYNKYLSLFCRAAGDGFGLLTMEGGTYILRNNSYAGYGSTTYDITCGGNTPNIVFQNNLHVGYKNPKDGQLPGVFYFGAGCPANPFTANDHNIFYNMRSCSAGGVCTDPHIADMPAWVDESSLDAVDMHLTAASTNAIGQGIAPSLPTDADGVKRPIPPSIGAYEFNGGVPPVTYNLLCTVSGAKLTCQSQ